MSKFAMSIKKHDRVSVGRCNGHNARLNEPESQLPKEAWLTDAGCHEVVKWDGEVLARAKGLAKRKDAVVAIELVIQVGNQTEWRHQPTEAHPAGKTIAGRWNDMKKLARAAQAAAEAEFGKENIVGIHLHTDESSPHVHVLVTPVVNGKLQAKNWLDGARSVAAIRKRIHAIVAKALPCEYTPGGIGGAPHDPSKGAGRTPPAPKPFGVLTPVVDFFDDRGKMKNQIDRLENEVKKLNQQCQKIFSELKKVHKKAADDLRKKDETIAKIAKERRLEREARLELATKLEETKARERARVVDLENRLAEALAERDQLRQQEQAKQRLCEQGHH